MENKNLQEEVIKMLSTESLTSRGSVSSLEDKKAPSSTQGLSEISDSLSDLQELSQKVSVCLEKQRKLRFITKEISEIIKKL